MSKGYLVFAQNSKDDYVTQACLLAMSLKITNKINNISIVTNDTVSDRYAKLFDEIIPIPWSDLAEGHDWKVHNRWKAYKISPYEETVCLDSDMIFLDDVSHWWEYLKNYRLFFTTHVKDYRGNTVTSDYYRKVFTENNLSNLYSAFYYFQRDQSVSGDFFILLSEIMENWSSFEQYFQGAQPKHVSVDVAAALAVKILDFDSQVQNKKWSFPTFTHMKEKLFEWESTNTSWISTIPPYMTDQLELYIGPYKQRGIFHYVDNNFVTTKLLKQYHSKFGVK